MNETKINAQESFEARRDLPQERVAEIFRLITREFLTHACLVNVQLAGRTISLTAEPDSRDAGKLIGSKASMSHAWRILTVQMCAKDDYKGYFTIKVQGESGEYKNGNPKERSEPWKSEQWPATKKRLTTLLENLCENLFKEPSKLTVEDHGDKTSAYIELSDAEPLLTTDAELQDALSRVFYAVGRANGRKLFLERLQRREA